MLKSTCYVEQNQLAAVQMSSLLQDGELDYAAYKGWTGLSDYASATPALQREEDAVRDWIAKTQSEYRNMTETLQWNYSASRPFCEQKEFIKNSELYHVLEKMPKCSLLHIHNAAALSPDGFISLLKDWTAAAVLNPQMLPIYVVTRPGGGIIEGSLLYHPTPQQMPFCELFEDFIKREGSEAALRSLISLTSMNRVEGVPYIWDEFNAIFVRTGTLLENSQFYYEYHYRAFLEMIEDRIEYAELRCGLTAFFDLPGTPQSFEPWNLIGVNIPFLDKLQLAADDAITDWNTLHSDPSKPGECEECRKFHIRVILSTRRDLDILDMAVGPVNQGDKILLKMDSAVVIRQNPAYEDMVIGFDLVSEEDRGKRTYTLFSRGLYENVGEGYKVPGNVLNGQNMLAANPRLRQLRIQMLDFYLHDGESIWADSDNMLDASVICKHRIGHGFQLSKSPHLLDALYPKQNPVPAPGYYVEPSEPFLEICPISNQMLQYYPDLRAHSAYELMKRGVQCVIGNDDPMLLDNPGLSYDFWEVCIGMASDLNVIKGLVFNAYICEYMADHGYPAAGAAYVLPIPALVADFNNNYWSPFLQDAYQYLHAQALV